MVAKSKIVKAKTKRGKRFLEGRKPKEFENVKKAMFIRGGRTNETVTKALKQFYMLKKPFSLMLQKKNMLKPFEDQTSLEYLAQKSDHSLFMFGFNSKKRPNSLIIGRTYDNQVLDMFELGVESMKTMDDFKVPKITLGIKPCLTFSGEAFEIDPEYIRLKCMLADFFKGEVVENIRLQGLEHVYNFTAVDGKVYLRSYRVIYKNSETKVPNVELEEIGPSLDLKLSRTKLASDALYKTAQKQSKLAVVKKKKNVSRDGLGTTFGRIHMEKQDFGKLQLRKVRALKTVKAKKGEAAESNSNENSTTAATEIAATD